MNNRVFDFHTHVFPDAVGPRAVAQLSATLPEKPSYDGTRAGLLRKLSEAGIDGALNVPVATRPDQVTAINTWAAANNRWPVLSFGAIHPDFPDIPTELRRVKDLGLKGVKLHPEYQSFSPDEPRLDVVWRTCRDLDLIALLHVGNDWLFEPPCKGSPATIARVLRAWPGLRFVAAHLGGFQMWSEFETELLGLPLYLDTSFAVGRLPEERLLGIIRRHGVDHILFGTDAPWQDPTTTLPAFLRLPLTPDEQRAILWENASRLLEFTSVVY